MEKLTYYGFSRSEVARFLPTTYEKVLDIGCGKGCFRNNLKDSCEVWGIEPSHAASDASKVLYKVLNGFYHDVYNELPNNYFDLVICNDVIEHMTDHDEFLESIKNKMTANGFIVGSIPNVRYFGNLYELLVKKDWFYDNSGILDRTHLRFFTQTSLKRTFIQHKYAIEVLDGINSEISKPFPKKYLKEIIRRTLLLFVLLSTLWAWKDVQFLQFAFRVKKT